MRFPKPDHPQEPLIPQIVALHNFLPVLHLQTGPSELSHLRPPLQAVPLQNDHLLFQFPLLDVRHSGLRVFNGRGEHAQREELPVELNYYLYY